MIMGSGQIQSADINTVLSCRLESPDICLRPGQHRCSCRHYYREEEPLQSLILSSFSRLPVHHISGSLKNPSDVAATVTNVTYSCRTRLAECHATLFLLR